MTEIRKVAVVGAGVMGAGIAAHVANAGVPVLLLDVVPEGAADRDAIAVGAIERMLRADPAPFTHPGNARHVTPGNIEDDLGRLGECDWIVEAVVERADVKRALYERIEGVRRDGSIVTSNTSTLRLSMLTEGMPRRFAADFLIAHFFNPPRYMRLLELVSGPGTRPEAAAAIRAFADVRLGKGVVIARDTPGFIANRIGIFWLQCAVAAAMEGGLSVEEADAVMGPPMGVPKTGVFGLLDMVGLDLMPHALDGMAASLPPTDRFHAIHHRPELIERMIRDGLTGRKGKGGFYRLDTTGGRRVKEAIDLATGAYRPARTPVFASLAAARRRGLRALLEHGDAGGRYAWRVLSETLAYAAECAPAIADDIAAVDQAMRLGYNWSLGPFELIDRIGPVWFRARLMAEGRPVPPLLECVGDGTFYRTRDGRLERLAVAGGYRPVERPAGVLMLADVKRRQRPVVSNRAASLWDLGDGVACLELHGRMNALGPGALALMRKAVAIVADRFKALVIHTNAANFSVGANIAILLAAATLRAWPLVRWMLGRGQRTFAALKYAPYPVVGAPSGLALGGGLEVLLHCDAVQAHVETYAGLVEAGVGVVPGWGGCKEMLLRRFARTDRPGGPMPPITKTFETITLAVVATSAAEARDHLFLRDSDGITMNRDRLLADAKEKALALADGYRPPEPTRLSLPGPTAALALGMAVDGFRRLGKATPHDAVVAGALAGALSGGATDITEGVGEDDLLRLERDAFMRLIRLPATRARLAHMLRTGKPLRN